MNQIESERECSDSCFSGVPCPIDEVKRIKLKIEDKKRQFDRNALNGLIIRADHLFLPNYIEQYIGILEELTYDHKYLAILIVIGGHVGGKEINSKNEDDSHCFLVKSIELITREILVVANMCSLDHLKTLNFSSKLRNAFDNSKTLLF